MTLQSIARTPSSKVCNGADLRTEPQSWAERRLKIPCVRGEALRSAGTIEVVIVDSGIPGAVGNDRDDDGHATDLRATILGGGGRFASSIDIRAIKCFRAQGWPTPDGGADAIRQVGQTGRKVVVLAWDTGHDTISLRDAIREVQDNAVVVIAAGNWSLDNDAHPNWPANHGDMDHVLTVMATDDHDERASFSSYGECSVYIAAPGTAMLIDPPASSTPGRRGLLQGEVRKFRGTSAATAHVARLAALVWAGHPDWTPKQVKDRIGATARKVDALRKQPLDATRWCCVTGGIANFAAALK